MILSAISGSSLLLSLSVLPCGGKSGSSFIKNSFKSLIESFAYKDKTERRLLAVVKCFDFLVKCGTESEKITASLSDDDVKEDNGKKDNDTVNAPTTVKKPPNSVLLKKFSKGKILELEIHAKIPEKRLYEGLHKLLEGWKQYGLKNLVFNITNMIITGKLVNDSILFLRSTLFEIMVLPNGDGRSLIKFNKKTGSTKTLTKLATEIQIILQKEGVLDK